MKVMATFDRSGFSEAILPQLALLATVPDVEIILMCVASDPGGTRRHELSTMNATPILSASSGDATVHAPLMDTVETKDQAIQRMHGEIQTYLRGIVGTLPPGPRYRTEAYVDSEPGPTIIDQARREQPDMIVLATHGRTGGGVRRRLFGGVAEQILSSGVAPVLLVRPQG
jgi:nucleotide-binding universal stress UspA family protein